MPFDTKTTIVYSSFASSNTLTNISRTFSGCALPPLAFITLPAKELERDVVPFCDKSRLCKLL